MNLFELNTASIDANTVRWLHVCASAPVPPTADGSFNHLLWQLLNRYAPNHAVLAPHDEKALNATATKNVPILYFIARKGGLALAMTRFYRNALHKLGLECRRSSSLEGRVAKAVGLALDRFQHAELMVWGDIGLLPAIRSQARNRRIVFAQRHYDYAPQDCHYDCCDQVIMQTRGQVRRAFESLNRLTPFVAVIPNGAELDVFHPASSEEKARVRKQHGLPESAVVALCPYKIAPHKGINYLRELVSRSISEAPNVLFLIVGSLHRSLRRNERTEFEKMVKLCRNVRWLGVLPRNEMPEIYKSADFCLMPCVWREGFSMSATEALASGLPVVAPTSGCYSEILFDGYNGITCAPENLYRGMMEAIKRLAVDARLRQELSLNARRYAEARLSRDKCFQNFDAFFMGNYFEIDEDLSFPFG